MKREGLHGKTEGVAREGMKKWCPRHTGEAGVLGQPETVQSSETCYYKGAFRGQAGSGGVNRELVRPGPVQIQLPKLTIFRVSAKMISPLACLLSSLELALGSPG